MKNASKTYLVRFISAMAAYSVLLVVAELFVNRVPASPWRYALMLVPVVPVIFAFAAFLQFFGHMDELQRKIQLYAFAFSFGASGLITFTYGLLESAGLPRLSMVFVFPLMIALWGIGSAVAARKYQ